jgi:hypothetical protein
MFGTQEEAYRAYLQHWEKAHPTELEKERAPPPPPLVLPAEQRQLHIRSDKAKSGYTGGADHPEELETEQAPFLQKQETDKKRKHEQVEERELPSVPFCGDNHALKRCKQEFIEEDHAAFQQVISAVEAVAQCGICSDTMKQACTVSGCGHTFCRSCIEEAVRVKGCCPVCRQPAWHRDISHARLLSGVMAELNGFRPAPVGSSSQQ